MPHKRLLALAAIVCGGIIFYLCYRAEGNWGFVLPYRGQKLLAMLLVGSAIASATMVFQTLTANRILTPSIIGLDALYLLSKMLVIFLAGTTAAQAARPPLWQFYLDTALMTAAAAALFATFLPLLARDIYRLLLIGIIFGVLCSKLTDLMARMLDPAAYTSFQAVAYARFDRARADLILPAAFIIGACLAWIWYKRHTLDILALGREQAINLGVAYPRELLTLMLTVSLLVAVSTALVGPTLFFGLLVSALACRLFPVPYHAIQLPAACLLACAILIIGQTLFERVFQTDGLAVYQQQAFDAVRQQGGRQCVGGVIQSVVGIGDGKTAFFIFGGRVFEGLAQYAVFFVCQRTDTGALADYFGQRFIAVKQGGVGLGGF